MKRRSRNAQKGLEMYYVTLRGFFFNLCVCCNLPTVTEITWRSVRKTERENKQETVYKAIKAFKCSCLSSDCVVSQGQISVATSQLGIRASTCNIINCASPQYQTSCADVTVNKHLDFQRTCCVQLRVVSKRLHPRVIWTSFTLRYGYFHCILWCCFELIVILCLCAVCRLIQFCNLLVQLMDTIAALDLIDRILSRDCHV